MENESIFVGRFEWGVIIVWIMYGGREFWMVDRVKGLKIDGMEEISGVIMEWKRRRMRIGGMWGIGLL